MQLLFKQRLFSWFDSYDIYDEAGQPVFTVKGQLAWGHLLKIYDSSGCEVGTVREEVFTFLPRFRMYLGESLLGTVTKEWSLFHPKFTVDCNGWSVNGDWMEWDYSIRDGIGNPVARVYKKLLNWTDTYVLDLVYPEDALAVLMLVLAIDAEKCSRGND